MLLTARQLVPTQADAEDVVQEAFAKFWASRAGARDPLAYLYACIRSAAADLGRQSARRGAHEVAVARFVPRETPASEAPADMDEWRVVEQALGQLPQEQRAVVVMKIWGRLTFPQIGQAADIPANTAASRYRYALQGLRELLRRESAT